MPTKKPQPNASTPPLQSPTSPEPGVTPYDRALTRQAAIDYEIASEGSSATDEIKLSRAMTLTALQARKYTEARAWQNTLSTALRIQARAEGMDSDRSDTVALLFGAADNSRAVVKAELMASPSQSEIS